MAAGADAVTATNRAYAALFGMVQRQATMVSFVGIFQLLGVMFFALVPLVLLMKRPKRRRSGRGGALTLNRRLCDARWPCARATVSSASVSRSQIRSIAG